MKMKKSRKAEWVIVFYAILLLCNGCGGREDTEESASKVDNPVIQESVYTNADTQTADIPTDKDTPKTAEVSEGQDGPKGAQSGEDLDAEPEANATDNVWYKSGSVYVDENGHRLEVFFDDEGTIQFAVDGLSLYNTMANDFQTENDWRIYSCDDGTTVIYYPGTPAHLEISDGEYAGIYEADDGK